MKRSRFLIPILALAFLSLPVVLFAGPGGPEGDERGFGRMGHGPGHHGGPLLPPPGYLDLSEEQRQAARAIHESFREGLRGDHEEMRGLRQQLHQALESENPDPTEVGRLMIDLHSRRDGFHAAREAATAEFEALLTPEQLEKWQNFKELRESRHGRHGRHGHGEGGPGKHGRGFGGHGFGGDAPEASSGS